MKTITRTADAAAIAEAAQHLRDGRLVAFATETVYGLGADATQDSAVAGVFAAKGRPSFNPLISHVGDVEAAEALGRFDARAQRLAARFWPGPLTLVLPRTPGCGVSLLATAGLDSIAIRVPAHAVAQALLRAVGRPVAAPSANRSGRVSPTTASHVRDELDGRIAFLLDGGMCGVGVESTVIDLTTDQATLLRPGGVTLEELQEAIGPVAATNVAVANRPRSPGMLASHYAPALPLRLEATTVRGDEVLLAFGPGPPLPGAAETLDLSRRGDPVEAAARLFAALRAADRPIFSGIAVMPVPSTGLGAAINDRLRRAAGPREAAHG